MSNVQYHGDAPIGQSRQQGHSSTRVMAPPGGRSSNIFGTDAPPAQPSAQGRNRQQPGGASSMSQVMNFTENQAQPVQPREFKSDTVANVFPEASGRQGGRAVNPNAPRDNNIFTSDNNKPKAHVGIHAPPGGHSSISFGGDDAPQQRMASPRVQNSGQNSGGGAESAVSPRRAAVKAQQAPGGTSSISFGDDGGSAAPVQRKGGRALVQAPADHNVMGGGDASSGQQARGQPARQAPGGASSFSFGKDSGGSEGPGAAKRIDYNRYAAGNKANTSNIFSSDPVPEQPRSGRRPAQAPGGNSTVFQ